MPSDRCAVAGDVSIGKTSCHERASTLRSRGLNSARGAADLVNAFALGGLTGGGGGGIVFPTVLIPVYEVPRALLTHSYSLIGLLRNTVRRPKRTESPHYGVEGMPAVGRSRSGRSV